MPASGLDDAAIREIHDAVRANPGANISQIGVLTRRDRATVRRYWPEDVPRPYNGVRAESDPIRHASLSLQHKSPEELAAILRASEGRAEPPPEPDPVEVERERIERTRRLKAEREELRAVAGERSLRAWLADHLDDAIARLPAPMPPRPTPETPGRVSERLVLLLSDWHAYETVKPERVVGLNEYNADVLGRRARKVIDTTIQIKTRLERGGWTFPELYVLCLGDMVSGTIHEVEKHTDAPNIMRAAVATGQLLGYCVRDLSAHFGRMVVAGVSGNHGRMPDARKVQHKDPTRTWDWLIYEIARISTDEIGWVEWFLPDAFTCVVRAGEHNILLNHGDGIPRSYSLPYYGADRFTRNLRDALHHTDQRPDLFVFGHHHEPGAVGSYILNNSLIGTQELGINAYGSRRHPSQTLLGLHHEHGLTHRWELYAGPGTDGPSYPVRPWLA